jgi:hypothetical protein|tara:strand:+ start:259 stop:636 length:378 start_codon:yes stop_codon:yes gene_type:complete
MTNMTSRERKEIRGYIGSGVVFLFVILLLVFLSWQEIPKSNNDSFKLIIGALIATIGAAVYVFIGKDPNHVEELQRKNDSLETKVDALVAEKDRLENLIIKMQEDLIDRILLVSAINHDTKKEKK